MGPCTNCRSGRWATAGQAAPVTELRALVEPPVAKPIEVRTLDRREAESAEELAPTPLTLIQTGANLGFAGGCNVVCDTRWRKVWIASGC